MRYNYLITKHLYLAHVKNWAKSVKIQPINDVGVCNLQKLLLYLLENTEIIF